MQVPPPQSPNATLDEAIRLSRAGRSKDGIQLALSVAQRFRDDGQSAPLRRALNVIAICQAAHGRYIEAVSHALDTYSLAHDAQDRIEECHALATLAASAGMILDTDEAAFPVLQYCLESARQFGDVALEARAHSLMGIRLGSMQRFDEAEREIHAAMKAGAAGGALTPRGLLLLNLAVLAAKRMRAAPEGERSTLAAAARARTVETMALAQREGNSALAARVHYNFGDIDRLTGDATSALAQFDHALAIEANLRSPTFLSHLYMARSEVLLTLERWDEAMEASQRAFDHATQHRPSRDTATAAGNLADLFARQGDEAQSSAWRQRAETEKEDFRRESQMVREKLVELWSQRSRWAAAA
jgi:tetratricopeptide (TPR) repeat protein